MRPDTGAWPVAQRDLCRVDGRANRSPAGTVLWRHHASCTANTVGATCQRLQHGHGIPAVPRLADDARLQYKRGIRPDDPGVREAFGDGQGFEPCQSTHVYPQGRARHGGRFGDVRHHLPETISGAAEQSGAGFRARGEYDGRILHAVRRALPEQASSVVSDEAKHKPIERQETT